MRRGEAQEGTGWDGRMVGSMKGDKGPVRAPDGCCGIAGTGHCYLSRLSPTQARAGGETQKYTGCIRPHWLPPRLSNNSLNRANATSPLRPPPCGWCGDGAQAVAARSPALRAPQTWTRWTVESLEPLKCGIPASSSSSSSQHQPRRLRALHPDLNSEKEEEKRQAWPPGRHQDCRAQHAWHISYRIQNT